MIGDEIKLTVNAFDVEMDSVCQYDFVTLRTHSEVDLVRGDSYIVTHREANRKFRSK